jgi:CelD/BcsL family acetyltransferase involved in cellulose biosynthesis
MFRQENLAPRGACDMTWDVRILASVDELRAAAPQWNDLWARSRATHPTVQAEHVAIWLETFGGNGFHGITLAREDQLIAALPLVATRRLAAFSTAMLPNNEWSFCGDLLLDPSVEPAPVLQRLVEALDQLPHSLLWLEGISLQRADWQALLGQLALRGRALRQTLWNVGMVEIAHDWETYFASRSRNHRRQIRRTADRLRSSGGGQLRIERNLAPADVESLLRRGFELEQRSWKSRAGSCVLNEPDVFEFYCRQARQLAATGNLELVFLELDGRPIAFEYGFRAKGIYFSPKVAYDEAFAECSPGQQLRALLYQRLQNDPDCRAVDFHGPLAEATARWATRSYPLGRITLAQHSRAAAALLRGHGLARSLYKSLRARWRPAEAPLQIRPLPAPQTSIESCGEPELVQSAS